MTANQTMRGIAVFLSLTSLRTRAEEPNRELQPLRIYNACGATPAARLPPDSVDHEVGTVFIHTVLNGEGVTPSLLEVACTYHWTDGALTLPPWLQQRDNGARPDSWTCEYSVHLLLRSLAGLPTSVVELTTLNEQGLDEWQGQFDVRLKKRRFTIEPANKKGLGVKVGSFPGWLVLSCPSDVAAWSTTLEARTALMQRRSNDQMKGCSVRVENPLTHRFVEGRCDGYTEIKDFWIPIDAASSAKPKSAR